MSVDREQIRRDAEVFITAAHHPSAEFARHCLTLLAELEQAERERDRFKAEVIDNTAAMRMAGEKMRELQARLTAADTLAEAAKDYVGPKTLALFARRKEGDTFIGSGADLKWLRLLEALADYQRAQKQRPDVETPHDAQWLEDEYR